MPSPVVKVLTQGIGERNLRDLDVYRSTGGYAQLVRAVKELWDPLESTCRHASLSIL